MAGFDPQKKPMSLQESEELLKGHAAAERTKDAWRGFGWLLLFVLALIGVALLTYLSVSFKPIAWVVGIGVFIYTIGAIASADRKK